MNFSIKNRVLHILLILISFNLNGQSTDPPFLKYMNHPWVDSIMKSLSTEEKVAQLIWVAGFSNRDLSHEVWLTEQIKKNGIGGVIFFQNSGPGQTEMINYFQQISKVPLMFVTDGEYGIEMRFENVIKFPFQMTLGAIRNDSLIYQMGKAVANQFKRAGLQINLIPFADVDNNPENPVIKFRSFGEDPENITRKSLMYINGFQDNGIIAAMSGRSWLQVSDTSRLLQSIADVIKNVADPEKTIKTIIERINKKEITIESVNEKCRKVLAAKYWAGLSNRSFIDAEKIEKDISPASTDALIRELYANALTVISNKQNIIPVNDLANHSIATLSINSGVITTYQKRISEYTKTDNYFIDTLNPQKVTSLLKKLKKYDLVIAGIFGADQQPAQNFGIPDNLDSFLIKLNSGNKCIITYFGNPYAIAKMPSLHNTDGVVVAYQENDYTQDLSAQLIFGGIGAHGKLPVTINSNLPAGFGIETSGNIRLQYGIPESAGMISEILNSKIDSIVDSGLRAKAFPGCVVMAARKGVVVFQKAYGYQTYDNRIMVDKNDLYDMASVTKISSTLAGLMLLNTEGKFDPDKTLGFYLPDFKNTNKGDIEMRDFLTHQAGLTPYINFWKETIKRNGEFKHNTFDYNPSKKYSLKVAQELYINGNYKKKMFKEIKKSKLGEKKYVYSDLTFIIAPEIIERLTGQKWYNFVTDSIYKKIGAYDIGFNPYLKYPLSRIVPTEYDSIFRKQQLQGTVHDEGAAMLGGISGHAGLFATANDMTKLMELYRRMGEYGGKQLIGKDVMEEYTRVQFPENNNRRGLGFDKPLLNNSELKRKDTYPSKSASPQSFGHSGYTGTFVWVDPVYEITYVFLCNRVYPTRNNNRVSDMNIRSEILQAIYDSIKK